MKCPNCRHWNEAGSRFCEECGIELPPQVGIAPQVSIRPPSESKPMRPASQMPSPSESSSPTSFEIQTPVPYSGPHLVLKSTGSIFKLGNAAVIGREDPTLQMDFDGYDDGKYISHRHAQIVKINDKYYIEDLGSANHTFVNGIKLAEGQAEPIDEGDVIRLGKIELTFHEK